MEKELAKAYAPQAVGTIFLAAHHVADGVIVYAHIVLWHHVATTLRDGSTEETLGQRTLAEHSHRDGPCTLTHDGHLLRITSEGCDVIVYPLQGSYLVHQSVVAADGTPRLLLALLAQFWQRQEAEDIGTIGDGCIHDASLGELLTVLLP